MTPRGPAPVAAGCACTAVDPGGEDARDEHVRDFTRAPEQRGAPSELLRGEVVREERVGPREQRMGSSGRGPGIVARRLAQDLREDGRLLLELLLPLLEKPRSDRGE
jgi:hypothetical protein